MFASIDELLSVEERQQYEMSQEELAEFVKCAQDIVYFCENYVKIQNNDFGIMQWTPWDFQKDFLRLLAEDNNVLAKFPRQCGKSTVTRGYLLWYALFNKDKNIAILANKEDLAIEQLDLLKQSYYLLPPFLQMGCSEYNKKNLKIGNGTRIIARATSENGVRGRAINKLYCDEFAFVADNIAQAFIRSVFPTIASGKNSNIIITSTPKGMNHFYDLWMKAVNGRGTFDTIEIPWNAVPGRDEEWAKGMIQDIGEIAFNQEFRCTFLGSDSTLINSEYLSKLIAKSGETEPLDIKGLPDGMRIFRKPLSQAKLDREDWHYVASLDSGMGMKDDSTVLQIALVKSNRNIHQVAVYSRNDLNIRDFIDNAMPLLKSYHDPRLIVEANGIGENALMTLNDIYMYENLVHFDPRGLRLGLIPTPKSKFAAVTLLKAYIEKNLLKLVDEKTVGELSNFGRIGNGDSQKYRGKNGAHDDHVTSLLWIPYYCNSPQYWGNIEMNDSTGTTKSLLDLPNDESVTGGVLTPEQMTILNSAGNSEYMFGDGELDAGDKRGIHVDAYNVDNSISLDDAVTRAMESYEIDESEPYSDLEF